MSFGVNMAFYDTAASKIWIIKLGTLIYFSSFLMCSSYSRTCKGDCVTKLLSGMKVENNSQELKCECFFTK